MPEMCFSAVAAAYEISISACINVLMASAAASGRLLLHMVHL